jgi:acyl carrier protein
MDDQVKLRGFRIELGDIEICLRRCEAVRSAVAIVHGEGSEARLVAYVAAEQGEAVLERIKRHVGEHLPTYMHPASYVVLERLPLTANGKVDKRALPAPSFAPIEHVAPATPTQALLAEIWQDALQCGEVSVTADFFELGGHSLLAMRLINAVQRRLDVQLPIRLIFEKSDIRNIAAIVDEQALRQRNLAAVSARQEHVELEW